MYQVKELFIKNIVDPEYRATRESLMEKLTQDGITLKQMGVQLKTKEKWLQTERKGRKRRRSIVETSSDSSEDEHCSRRKARKISRTESSDSSKIKISHIGANELGKL